MSLLLFLSPSQPGPSEPANGLTEQRGGPPGLPSVARAMSGHISSDHSRSASRSSHTQHSSQGQTSDSMSRRSLGRNPNVFSDQYSLEPIDPDQIDRAPSPPSSLTSSTTLRSSNHPQNAVSTTTTENENPFGDDARVSFDEPHRSSLPRKGPFTSHNSPGSGSTTPTTVQRNQSTSSRFSMPRALSPYTGATGPSHPYAMYPQVGVSRSPSVTSTSTIRQSDHPLGNLNGPQHPYAMYPQNVVDEGVDDTVIPVGFPGHNSRYQPPTRRRDDDVGDIIGPDGHTEPLPPYSRYPAGVVPKPPGAEAETMSDANPPPDTHDLNATSTEPPASEETLVPQSASNGEHEGRGAAPLTGVMAFEEKLKRKGKQTACCGLPIWTLVLMGIVMVIAALIGGVIGGVVGTKNAAAQQKAQSQSSGQYVVTVTAPPMIDASPVLSTPTNLLPLPTSGDYVIPANPQNSSKFCVADQHYKDAWSCMESGRHFDLYFGGHDGRHSVVFPNHAPTTAFTYGAQPPLLPTPTQTLNMKIDTSDVSLGPALFFFTLVDKLVIVPEDVFSAGSMKQSLASNAFQQRRVAVPGQKPWFCWWNSTTIEFFLYINQTTRDSHTSATATTDSNLRASTATPHKRGETEIYPRRIKIEERRDFPFAPAPYCQQMQVLYDGKAGVLSGQVINIKEIEPTPTTTYASYYAGGTQTYTATAEYASACYCESLTD